MYFYLDMPFNSTEQAKNALGDIKMFFVGTKELGYKEQGYNKYRKYILTSKDIPKLQNITNALEGSTAYVSDIQKTYFLCHGQWIAS